MGSEILKLKNEQTLSRCETMYQIQVGFFFENSKYLLLV